MQYVPSNKLARAKSTCYKNYSYVSIINPPVQSLQKCILSHMTVYESGVYHNQFFKFIPTFNYLSIC